MDSFTIHFGEFSVKCDCSDCSVCNSDKNSIADKVKKIFNRGPTNEFKTTSTTLLTFLPMFLINQFRRKANIYFLSQIIITFTSYSNRRPIFSVLPFSFVLTVSFCKDFYEFWNRRKENLEEDNTHEYRYNYYTEMWERIKRKDIRPGDILIVKKDRDFPADMILLQSQISSGICSIKTTNLDGETNVKIKRSIDVGMFSSDGEIDTKKYNSEISGFIKSEKPNARMDSKGWRGKLVYKKKSDENLFEIPALYNNLLLRGCVLINTNWVIAMAVFIGNDTKYLQQMQKTPIKTSYIEKMLEKFIYIILLSDVVFIVTGSVLNYIFYQKNNIWYMGESRPLTVDYVTHIFCMYVILETFIPISLYVVIEISKMLQAYVINNDIEMRDFKSGNYTKVRTSNLIENLGQVSIVFSDKTGTLTQNKMVFSKASINGTEFDIINGNKEKLLLKMSQKEYTEYFKLLSSCNTVIPNYENCKNVHLHSKKCGQATYQAESPDEKALVVMASNHNFKLTDKFYATSEIFGNKTNVEFINLMIFGKKITLKILEYIEFDSERKRMSVIIHDNLENKYKIYTKGADSTIFPLLSKESKARIWGITSQHIESFSEKGLRTLVCAYKEISEKDFEKWYYEYRRCKSDLSGNEQSIDDCIAKIENDLTLLGVTAVEDKLQEDVPKTLRSLKEADVSVWILTGDKTQTALNIGKSCGLLTYQMYFYPNIIVLDIGENVEDEKILKETIESLNKTWDVFKDQCDNNPNQAFVISGRALNAIMPKVKKSKKHDCYKEYRELLINILMKCRVVICCRLSPYQKSQLVKAYIKRNPNKISLAIGDGANDIPMIKSAHVGIGIMGKEGLQASRSGDFAIPEFKHLSKLMLYHGAINYARICKLINFSFFKNISIVTIMLGFVFFSGYSCTILIPPMAISLHNLIYTHLPIFIISFVDEPYSKKIALEWPILYKRGQKNKLLNYKSFFVMFLLSFITGIIVILVQYLVFDKTFVGNDGKGLSLCYISYSSFNSILLVITAQSILLMEKVTVFNVASLFYATPVFIFFEYMLTYTSKYFFENNYGCASEAMTQPTVWIAAILSVAICIIPQIYYKFFKSYNFPSNIQVVKELMKAGVKKNKSFDTNKAVKIRKSNLSVNYSVGFNDYYPTKKEARNWTDFMKAKVIPSLMRVK